MKNNQRIRFRRQAALPCDHVSRSLALFKTLEKARVNRISSSPLPLFSSAFRLSLILLFCGLLLAAPALAQKKSKRKPPPRLDEVVIDRFDLLEWRPEDNYFRAPGPVRVTLRDAVTGEATVLEADDAEGTPTGDIKVKGRLTLTRSEGVLTGSALTYRAATQTGEVSNAQARLENLLLRGEKIELLPEQRVRATHASLTTCQHGRPDYHLTAREVRISPDGRVQAKHVTFWLGDTRIISLPGFTRNFRRTVSSPFPLPSYSKENGIQMRVSNESINRADTTLDYNILFSIRHTPQGTVVYEHDLGSPEEDAPPPRTRLSLSAAPLRTALEVYPALLRNVDEAEAPPHRTTLYALVESGGFVYNRRRTDLRVSRLPEVGVYYQNILNRKPEERRDSAAPPRARTVFGGGFLSPANWLLNAEAGIGYIREHPARKETGRLALRADATSPLFLVTPSLYFRYGGNLWANLYTNGNAYLLAAPEAELSYLLRPNTLIGAAYRYMQDVGSTPFLFDRRDVRHELRLRYAFLGAHWGYDLSLKYDLERRRAYDSIVSIRRRFDCMEVGLSYQTRSQGFGLILNLLPGSSPHPKTGRE